MGSSDEPLPVTIGSSSAQIFCGDAHPWGRNPKEMTRGDLLVYYAVLISMSGVIDPV